ncbi:hypothetical protein TNCV_2109941 [Trichonephila clavipes]|nr:hypothetical protein TNCV_2109941 [Trichonephila clavipes]
MRSIRRGGLDAAHTYCLDSTLIGPQSLGFFLLGPLLSLVYETPVATVEDHTSRIVSLQLTSSTHQIYLKVYDNPSCWLCSRTDPDDPKDPRMSFANSPPVALECETCKRISKASRRRRRRDRSISSNINLIIGLWFNLQGYWLWLVNLELYKNRQSKAVILNLWPTELL